MKRILLACGGSGGHIFPGLSVASKLKCRDVAIEIFFICTRRSQDVILLSEYNYRFKTIPIEGLKLYPNLGLNCCKFLVKLLWSFVYCFIIIRQYRPDVVIGFGGYLSVPVIILASILRIPTLIHEQNIIPSLSNRILAKFAHRIALTFKETDKFFRNKSKLIVTGNPLRPQFLEDIDRKTCLNNFGFNEERFTILIMGGSQGSHKINRIFMEMFAHSMDVPQRQNFQIIHITGYTDYNFVYSQYQKLNTVYQCFPFLKEINCAYLAADLVIARAGASTILEISYFRRPAILVPHPDEKIHQKENALVLSRKEAAVVIFDKDLTPDRLKSELLNLVDSPRRMILMAERVGEFACAQAADNLAELILNIKECGR
jgi:UDP-N-acetylglucosamine--N-acetylmuramyl-(pentapeptide) pyrophosphoryl-undecaprenol N-acetylglucosamine transferase